MIGHVSLGELVAPAETERAGSGDFIVLSMTSSAGLVPQSSIFKKAIASRDLSTYKVVRPNQLVVGIHVDEGALGFSGANQTGIVSPAYAIWRLKDADRVHIPYLDRFVRSPQAIEHFISKYRETAERRGKLTHNQFLALSVPFPSLSEQRRIADILDKADALRTKRREALAQIDRLAQSIFVEMFGDPVSNSYGWPRLALGDLLSGIDSGWSPVCLDRPAEAEEWGVLKLGAVTSCVYDQQANKALPQGVEPVPSIEVQPGDLLFSRKNTYELVAACALVETTRPRLMMSDLIFRLQVRDAAGLDKTFLHALLTNPRKRAEVQKLAGGSAGSMPNISKAKLLAMKVEVPPIALQQDFASRVGKARRIRASSEVAAAETDSLFASLRQRAFQGEL